MKTNTATKSLRGKKGTVGAPAKTIKFPRGGFTIAAVVALNPHVCELTVRNKIEAGVASKELVRLSENLETNKVGRPSFRYMTKAAASAARATRKAIKAPRKATIPAAVLAPVTTEISTPVAEITTVEAPASIEAVG